MSSPKSKSRNRILWVTQGLLAALFLFAGLMKLVGPVASMDLPVPLIVGTLATTIAIGRGRAGIALLH